MASASSGDNDEKKKSFRSGFLGKTGTHEAPMDKTYYNTLNISPTASASEIKRAYYTLSLQYHPDRTQTLDDLTRREYSERFKLISQAYSILSDPEKRTLYNRYGKDERLASNDASEMSFEEFNPEEFFRFIFGGEEFVGIVGDFALAKSFKHVISEVFRDPNQTPEQQEEQQRQRTIHMEERNKDREERVEKLAANLIVKLSVFTDACEAYSEANHIAQAFDLFIEVIRTDTANLLEAPYGENLLHSIGYIYSSRARFWSSKMDTQEGHIGKRIMGFGKQFQSSWKDRVHVVRETVRTVKCAIQLGQSMSRLAQVADEESNESETPFQHHSGHLEYNGFTPPEPTASATPPVSTPASPVKAKPSRKSSAQPIVPLTDEDKRKLEADTVAKSMEALWRAVKLEIESVERDVCDRVLNDPSCSRELRRSRCKALSKLGELWQQASPNNPSSSSSS